MAPPLGAGYREKGCDVRLAPCRRGQHRGPRWVSPRGRCRCRKTPLQGDLAARCSRGHPCEAAPVGLPGSLWARGTGPEWCLFQRKYDPLSRGRIARRPFPSPSGRAYPEHRDVRWGAQEGEGGLARRRHVGLCGPRHRRRADDACGLGLARGVPASRSAWASRTRAPRGAPRWGGGYRGSEGGDLLGGAPLSGCAIDLGWGAFQAVREVRDGGCFSCGARSEG